MCNVTKTGVTRLIQVGDVEKLQLQGQGTPTNYETESRNVRVRISKNTLPDQGSKVDWGTRRDEVI